MPLRTQIVGKGRAWAEWNRDIEKRESWSNTNKMVQPNRIFSDPDIKIHKRKYIQITQTAMQYKRERKATT